MGEALFWIAVSFISGVLPFSVWIGRLALGTDIREYGDGNPGAFNVFRAGGKGWGWAAILLDGLKGAVPVSLAHFGAGLDGWALVAAALAPVVGHAYSPLLGFRGGKALAVTFGSWAGLSLWVGPVLLGVFFALFRFLLKNDRRTVFAGQAALLFSLVLLRADWTWFAFWAGSSAVFFNKHAKED